jgi:hypothetical protein
VDELPGLIAFDKHSSRKKNAAACTKATEKNTLLSRERVDGSTDSTSENQWRIRYAVRLRFLVESKAASSLEGALALVGPEILEPACRAGS